MAESPAGEKLVLTTETTSGIRDRILVLLLFGTIAAMLTVGEYRARAQPFDWTAILAAFGLQSLLFGAALLLVIFAVWQGTWRLDDEGVTYEPCHRRPRSLRWASVERIIWRGDCSTLQGGRTRIPIPWNMFPKESRAQAVVLATAKLAPLFDLKDVVVPTASHTKGTTSRLRAAARLAKLAALGAVLTLPPFVVLVWISPSGHGHFAPLYYLLGVDGCCMAYGLFLANKDRRMRQRVHPQWPWRVRRHGSVKSRKAITADAEWLAEVSL